MNIRTILTYTIFTALVLVGLFYMLNAYIYSEKQEDAVVPIEVPAEREGGYIQNRELGIEFPYRDGPAGYVITDNVERMSNDPSFIQGYELMLATDNAELQNSTVPREGPPTITLRIYKNAGKLSPTAWATKYDRESNRSFAFSEPVETTVGGANALMYTTDGLYATNVYVVTHGNYVYLFTGSFIDDASPMKTDLLDIIDAIKFI